LTSSIHSVISGQYSTKYKSTHLNLSHLTLLNINTGHHYTFQILPKVSCIQHVLPFS
jgi:hypothetical protein